MNANIWVKEDESYTIEIDGLKVLVRGLRSRNMRSIEVIRLANRERYSAHYSPQRGEVIEQGNYGLFAECQDAIESARGIPGESISGLKSILEAIQDKHLATDEN